MSTNTLDAIAIKKADMKLLIDSEHGKDHQRNINLSGYTVYRGNSFISFRFIEVNNKLFVKIDYLYVTNKTNFIKLIGWCVKFWSGNGIQGIFYQSHKRKSNLVEKTFPALGFEVVEGTIDHWKHDWECTNGFDKNAIVEAIAL